MFILRGNRRLGEEFGYGPGTSPWPGDSTTAHDARACKPVCRRTTFRLDRKPPDLAVDHLLSHVEQEPPVAFLNATHQPAKLVQKTSLFPGAAPNDVVRAFTLRKSGQLGRFFSVIEELIKWDLQSAGHFLERFDGRNRVAVLDARDIATKKSGALFDIPLGKLLFFAQDAKSVTDNHVGIVPYGYSAYKRKS